MLKKLFSTILILIILSACLKSPPHELKSPCVSGVEDN